MTDLNSSKTVSNTDNAAGTTSSQRAEDIITTDVNMDSTSPRLPADISELFYQLQRPVHIFLPLDGELLMPPAIIPQPALCAVSKHFARCFDPNDDLIGSTKGYDGVDHEFYWSHHTLGTVNVFLWWLTTRTVPKADNIDNRLHGKENYVILLSRAWVFADEFEVREMQNDVMRALLGTLQDDQQQRLTVEVLQTILGFSRKGSVLRAAVLEEALWLEEHGHEEGILAKLDDKWLDELTDDVRVAKERLHGRKGRRGELNEYMVKVDE